MPRMRSDDQEPQDSGVEPLEPTTPPASPVTGETRAAVAAAVTEMQAEQPAAKPENALAEAALQQYQTPVDVAGEIQAGAERLVEQMRQQAEKPQLANEWRRPPEQATVQSQIDRERMRLLREEAEKQRKQKAEVEAAREEGRRPRALFTSEIAEMPDESVIMDEDGKPAGTPGMHLRIARMKNADQKLDTNRVMELGRFGYKPVLSRVTGKPVTSRLGMLVGCPPEAEGRRRALHEARVTNPEDLKKGFMARVEQTNQEAGRTYGHGFDPRIDQTTTTREPLA